MTCFFDNNDWKPKHHKTGISLSILTQEAKKRNKKKKCNINKKNQEWTEKYIIIPKESRLEKVSMETEKSK